MPSDESVSHWLTLLQGDGDADAAQRLWQRYFGRLVGLARARLQGQPRRAADEEDVALSAFASFCRAAEAGRFPRLADRHDLWRLLLTITLHHARNLARHETRDRRDSRRRLALDLFDLPAGDLARLGGEGPDPALAAEVADRLRHLLALLPEAELAVVARDLLAGYTAAEIARRRACSLRTVERRTRRIRQRWQSAAEPGQAEG